MEENKAQRRCHLQTFSKPSWEAKSGNAESADSTHLGTEAPDLKNWFSSYVYQSPELTSSYCFEDSLLVGEECEDRGLYVDDSDSEEQHTRADLVCFRGAYPSRYAKKNDADGCRLHESSAESSHHITVKVPEYFDSLPSEPPDIRNWFSSYVYESPTLDTAEIGGSLSITVDSGGTEDDFREKEETRKYSPTKTPVDFTTDESIRTDGCVKFRGHIEFVKRETDSEREEKILFPGGVTCHGEKAANEILDGNLTKVYEYPRLKDDSTMETLEEEKSRRARSASCCNHMSSESPNRLTERVCTDEAVKSEKEESAVDAQSGSGWILPNHKVKQGDSGSINRDIRRHRLLQDGFTSTACASSRLNNRNASVKHEETENLVSPAAEKCTTIRKALTEITNVHGSRENEIAGKWKCPQRRKPYIGPPLKQLRLEQWVHRG